VFPAVGSLFNRAARAGEVARGPSSCHRRGAATVALGVGLMALTALPSEALAGGAVIATSPETSAVHAVRWGLALGVALELAIIIIVAVTRVRISALVVGKDKRLSTSKTIATVWTLVVGATLFAMVYAALRDHGKSLSATDASKVVGQYAVLFGGPLGAAILAKTIVTGQNAKDPSAKPASTTGKAKVSDLIANDAGNTDLGDLQYVLFNAIALLFVLGTFIHHPIGGLPHIPDVLLGLTSVSAVGYVGKKMLPNETAIAAKLDPDHAKVGDKIAVVLTGLSQPSHPGMFFWARFGPTDKGQLINAQVAGHAAGPEVFVPALNPALKVPIPVTLVAEDGTVVKAENEFTYDA
jgi:hypothetical protein